MTVITTDFRAGLAIAPLRTLPAPQYYAVRLTAGVLAGSTILFCLWAMPALAETAPNAAYLHLPHTQPNAPQTSTTPEEVTGSRIITPTPAPATSRTPHPGFWDGNRLLPPLTSRPEAYGQPQALELKPLPTALMHQGPWGVFNANTGAAAGFGTVGYYAVSRWAEDWSSLRDKRNRLDA